MVGIIETAKETVDKIFDILNVPDKARQASRDHCISFVYSQLIKAKVEGIELATSPPPIIMICKCMKNEMVKEIEE